jgi:D-3-phosphoglycerate dehydrogenase / 2-oxoglutarate reductase
MKILCVGDAMIPPGNFGAACAEVLKDYAPEVHLTDWLGITDKAHLQNERIKVEKGGPGAVPIPENVRGMIADYEVLLVHYCPVAQALMEAAPRLKIIGITRGGVENIDVAAATRRGIPVVKISGRNAQAVSDFAIGLMLAEMRNIARSHVGLLSGKWRKEFVNVSWLPQMSGKTVGLVGLGKVGALVARKLSGFGVKVQGYDPFVNPDFLGGLNVELVDLDRLMATSDIVSIHARLTAANRGLIGAREIALMKPTAILVNTARAGLVDEEALLSALQHRSIGGAALDVFGTEPLPAAHPFLTLDNVTLTSHLAGTTVDALTRSPYLLCEEVRRFLQTGRSGEIVNPPIPAPEPHGG